MYRLLVEEEAGGGRRGREGAEKRGAYHDCAEHFVVAPSTVTVVTLGVKRRVVNPVGRIPPVRLEPEQQVLCQVCQRTVRGCGQVPKSYVMRDQYGAQLSA